MHPQMPQPSTQLHEPGQTEVNDETSIDSAGAGGQYAEDETAEKGGDTFSHRFPEMDGAIEGGHWKYGIGAGIAQHRDDQQSTEKKFDAQKIETVGNFIRQ